MPPAFRASGTQSLITSFVAGRWIFSSHWLLFLHEMKSVQPPAVTSIHRLLTAKRVHRSSSIRHMYTLLKWRQKSAYAIQNVPSSDLPLYARYWRSRLFHCEEPSDHFPVHSIAWPS